MVEIPYGGELSFAGLQVYGDVLELHAIPGAGLLDFGASRPSILAYDQSEFSKLAKVSDSQNILLADGILAGMEIPVAINGRTHKVVSSERKGVLSLVEGDAVLLPKSQLDLGEMRTGKVVFFAAGSLEMMRRAEQVVQTIVSIEFDKYNYPRVTSSLALQERLEAVQRKAMAQKGVALVALSVALALIYGALALQEYRLEEFSAALMRSMGYSSLLLVAQRCLESAFFVALGLLVVVGGIYLWDASVVIPWDYAIVFLSGGVILSMIPLFKAADREIGLVLA